MADSSQPVSLQSTTDRAVIATQEILHKIKIKNPAENLYCQNQRWPISTFEKFSLQSSILNPQSAGGRKVSRKKALRLKKSKKFKKSLADTHKARKNA